MIDAEEAEVAARLEEFERSGGAEKMLAEMEMDRQEGEFLMGPYSGMSADEAAEQLAFECDCEVCEAGGNCCGSPIGNRIGELLATAYDHGLGVEQISPEEPQGDPESRRRAGLPADRLRD